MCEGWKQENPCAALDAVNTGVKRAHRRESAEDRGKVTVGLGSRAMKHELMLEERGTPAFKERSDAFRRILLVGLAEEGRKGMAMQCELQREHSTLGIMHQVRAYTGI